LIPDHSDRCLQTVQPTAKALNLPIYVEHGSSFIPFFGKSNSLKNKGLSEWYSPVVPGTGLHPRPGSATSLRSHFPQIDPNWSSIWYPTQKGETVSQVHDRSDGFLTVFLSRLEEQHERILLMSHAAPIITLVRSLVGDRQLPLLVGCCSLSELVQESGGGVGSWKPIKLADTTHLDKGPLREWGFDYVEIEAGEVCHSFSI